MANATTVADLQARIEALEKGLPALQGDVDAHYIIFAGALVFFMQAGFSMLEAGCVGAKNVSNILYKNLMDACIGAICFWLLGYGFAYGDDKDGKFIGTANFALTNEDGTSYHMWFFQWAFAATAATIVSGAVAERTKITAYFAYAIILTTFIYPIVVHWVWDSEGFMCNWMEGDPVVAGSKNLMDFAGSGVVHMVGGFAGLMGAIIVGPRYGRFEHQQDSEGKTIVHKEHNRLTAALGVCILWFGWYGFNCGSTLMINGYGQLASRVAVTTTLAAASAGVTVTIFKLITTKQYDLMASLNGVLSGLVSITASCHVTTPEGAFGVGIVGAFVYMGSSALLVKLKVDDPLDACPIHGCAGIWGVLSVGIFGVEKYACEGETCISSGAQFGMQFVGVIIIFFWTVITSGIMFFIINKTIGMRVSQEVEIEGLDASEHGGSAYTSEVLVQMGESSKNLNNVQKPVVPEDKVPINESS
jgi:Amt family ammonium transporter